MKQYRIRTDHNGSSFIWSEWHNLDVPLTDNSILTIQFSEALTVEESKEFFKHFMEEL